MEHYVTLFDSFFLPQGLALHMSMERIMDDYTLWILCVDDRSHEVLSAIDLPRVRLLRLSELETKNLLRVKAQRTKGEYCWTLTPFAPRFVFEVDPEVSRVTYLDADLWFRKHPRAIFREFEASGKKVLITDHAYAPENDNSAMAGYFCVQFMTFVREAEVVRKWWEDRCIEWCHAWYEEGKLGDQKYLDDWPERFPVDVHVLEDQGLAMGPWNATRFPYGRAIFYHFHSLRIASDRRVDLGSVPLLPTPIVENIYKPYLRDIRAAVGVLKSHGFDSRPQVPPRGLVKSVVRGVRLSLAILVRKLANLGYTNVPLKY